MFILSVVLSILLLSFGLAGALILGDKYDSLLLVSMITLSSLVLAIAIAAIVGRLQ